MKITFVLALWAVLIGAAPRDADQETIEKPTDLAEEFLVRIAAGDAGRAVQDSFSPNMLSLMGAKITPIVAQIDAYFPGMLGNSLSNELIRDEQIAQRVRRLVYFMYTEKIPVVWEFYYYQVGEEWHLVNFSFNTDFKSLEIFE